LGLVEEPDLESQKGKNKSTEKINIILLQKRKRQIIIDTIVHQYYCNIQPISLIVYIVSVLGYSPKLLQHKCKSEPDYCQAAALTHIFSLNIILPR
jgi:hypothetical protein